jgi:aminomuconate-semialdehyde/2-hydroxymuconate-6-semialdehyde dehydrogenase
MRKILNFIGGEFVPPVSGNFLENIEPAKGAPYSLIPDSDEKDVEKAIASAKAAFPGWSRVPVLERARILNKMADLIREDLDNLAEAESRDSGKPLSLSKRLDIPRSESNLRFFASAVIQFHGESYLSDEHAINYTTSTPLGVVACISPWNLPLYLFTWKIAPALAAGNTVVAKPSEITPLTAYLLCNIAHQAGLPPGVLNVVHGTGPKVGGPLTSHKEIKAISFTGSTATGRKIAETTASQFKKVSLEMGGKNANIIFADADLNKALETTVRSSFLNQGQICLCGSRILVEKSIYKTFKEKLVERALDLKVGDPLDPVTDQGAVVSKVHFDKIMASIQHAVGEGGKILCGGKAAKLEGELKDGYFVEPTLIEGLAADAKTNQEEIFGPVVTLIPFDNEDEAIRLANSTRYGLAASVWTGNVQRAHRVSAALESGIVWVNTWMFRDLRTPFGGVKESGVGREGGMEALKFFTEVKNICISLT